MFKAFDPGFGLDHGGLHPTSTSSRQASIVSRSASGGTITGGGTTQAAWLNGRGTQKRSQLLARQGFLKAIPAPDDRQSRSGCRGRRALVDRASRAARSVRGDAEMAPVDPQASSGGAPGIAARRRSPDDRETQAPDDLGDQFSVAVIADQDVHLGPGPVMGREEHDLMEEGVDVTLTGLCGRPRVRPGGP